MLISICYMGFSSGYLFIVFYFFIPYLGTASQKRGPMKIKKLPIKSNVGEYLDADNVLHSDSITNEFMSSYPDVNIQLNNSETNCTCDDYICCDNQEKLATVNNETGMSEQKW